MIRHRKPKRRTREEFIMKKLLAASAVAITMAIGFSGAGSAAPLAAKDSGGIVKVHFKHGHKHGHGHRHHGRYWRHGYPYWAYGWKPYYGDPYYYKWRWDGYRYVCDYFDAYGRPLCR